MTAADQIRIPSGLTHTHITREIRRPGSGCPRCDAIRAEWARAKEEGR